MIDRIQVVGVGNKRPPRIYHAFMLRCLDLFELAYFLVQSVPPLLKLFYLAR